MQGFNYSQLYSALQSWPLKSSVAYLAALNRIIWMGELRLVRDMDLEIFEVHDTVALSSGATSIPKPAGSQVLTLTAAPTLNATAGTLSAPWAGATGPYVATFADGINVTAMQLTASSTSATWTTPLSAAQSAATLTLNPLFIAERALWVTYNAKPARLVKRSFDFLQSYNPLPGQPRYYCDDGTSQWLIAPAGDAGLTGAVRRYMQRPQSIVVAGNTWLGDNVGDVLFVACLMESEGWLKADDRYQDMARKYYQELLPAARGEVAIAARRGMYSPMGPVASVAQPAPAAPPQGQ